MEAEKRAAGAASEPNVAASKVRCTCGQLSTPAADLVRLAGPRVLTFTTSLLYCQLSVQAVCASGAAGEGCCQSCQSGQNSTCARADRERGRREHNECRCYFVTLSVLTDSNRCHIQSWGQTLLLMALANSDHDTAVMLIEAGADVNASDNVRAVLVPL